MPITALYAGVLGLMAVYLAFLAGSLRGKTQISIGDGGNPELLLAMRRHANFIEFVPLCLVLIGVLEMNGAPTAALHGLGASLVVCRVAHAVGLQADTMQGIGRLIGAGGSTIVLVVASIWAVTTFF